MKTVGVYASPALSITRESCNTPGRGKTGEKKEKKEKEGEEKEEQVHARPLRNNRGYQSIFLRQGHFSL